MARRGRHARTDQDLYADFAGGLPGTINVRSDAAAGEATRSRRRPDLRVSQLEINTTTITRAFEIRFLLRRSRCRRGVAQSGSAGDPGSADKLPTANTKSKFQFPIGLAVGSW